MHNWYSQCHQICQLQTRVLVQRMPLELHFWQGTFSILDSNSKHTNENSTALWLDEGHPPGTWQKPPTGAPSTVSPKAKTLGIKERKRLEKSLTCFLCLKDNAQTKAHSADRMYQGTAPQHSSCGHCQTPGEELQKCPAPAPSELAWLCVWPLAHKTGGAPSCLL